MTMSMVRLEHSSANPSPRQRSPVRLRGRSHTGVMDYDKACLMHLTPGPQLSEGCGCIGFLSPRLWHAQKEPRFLFEKRRGHPREFWSLVSTIDGSTLPQDCVRYIKKLKRAPPIVAPISPPGGVTEAISMTFQYQFFWKSLYKYYTWDLNETLQIRR